MTKRRTPWNCARCGVSDGDRDNPRSKLCAACAAYLREHDMWWCLQCSQAKAQDEFSIGFQCAACLKAKGQQWRADHADEQKLYRQVYYNANYDTLKAYRDDYYAVNRDTVLAQKQTYYEANREEIKHKVRSRRPSRRAESIQKEQERQEQKHDQYLANSRRAAQIDLVRPIVRTLELITDTPPSMVTPLLTPVPTVTGKYVFRPTSGVLYTLARQWPWDAAPTNERRGVSYFLLLRERAEPTYLTHQFVAASGAPVLLVIERRAVPRKVVNHAQTLLRTMAARVSPLVPEPLREAVVQPSTGAQRMVTLYPYYVDRILNEAHAQGCRHAEQAAAASRCFDLLTLFPEHQAASDLVFSLFCTPRLIDELRCQLAKTIPEWDDRPHQQRQRLGTIFTWLSRWDKHVGMDMRLPPDDVADTLRCAQRILTLSYALGDEHSADLAWPLLTKAFAQTHAPQHARAWAAMVLASCGFFADAAAVLAIFVHSDDELMQRLMVEVRWWRDHGEALPWLPPPGDGSYARHLLTSAGDLVSATEQDALRRTRSSLLISLRRVY